MRLDARCLAGEMSLTAATPVVRDVDCHVRGSRGREPDVFAPEFEASEAASRSCGAGPSE